MPLSLQNRFAIEGLMARYAYAIDVDCTEEEFLDLFTEDAQMLSPYSGVHEGVEGVKLFRSKFVPRRGKLQIWTNDRRRVQGIAHNAGGDACPRTSRLGSSLPMTNR